MLCAVHCAALPIVLVLAPTIGAGFASPTFEIGFISFASLLGLASLLMGYRLHRVRSALILLLPGTTLLWAAVLIEPIHHNVIVHAVSMASGGSLIAIAHVLNLRLSHRQSGAAACPHQCSI